MMTTMFSMFKGDDVKLNVTVDTFDGSLIDAQSIRWQLFDADGPLISKNGVEIVGNMFAVYIAGTDTATIDPGQYYHEIEIVDADGNTSTVLASYMILNPARIS